jgi:hypothetical protein
MLLVTSRVKTFPNLSWNVSLKMIESPVIFTTYPLNTGSFSLRKYALSIAFTTTAIIPVSDFTTPLSAIWSIVRQRFPVLHPEPTAPMFTTGLVNGSLRPTAFTTFVAGFFPSAFLPSVTATAGVGLGACLTTVGLTAATADFCSDFAEVACDFVATADFFVCSALAGSAFVAAATAGLFAPTAAGCDAVWTATTAGFVVGVAAGFALCATAGFAAGAKFAFAGTTLTVCGLAAADTTVGFVEEFETAFTAGAGFAGATLAVGVAALLAGFSTTVGVCARAAHAVATINNPRVRFIAPYLLTAAATG